MTDGGAGSSREPGRTEVYFEATSDGLVIRDPIERCREVLQTDSPVDPTPADLDRIDAPVTNAVAVDAGSLTLGRNTFLLVWPGGDRQLRQLNRGDSATFEGGSHLLSPASPVKLYVAVDGPMTVEVGQELRVSVGDGADVAVGARSNHTRPAATVTATSDPRDLMRAVSTFGSALKSTGPERSWPTMRGHPPAVELGDEASIPDGISRPETGTRVEVPPAPGPVFVVAPLAYYLGAAVVPGSTPRLVTDSGLDHELPHEGDLARGVQRLLRRVHFLDCVTRVEGWYSISLREREAFLADREFDVEAWYRATPAERLERYLAVPQAAVDPHLPRLDVCGYVDPDPGSVTALPHLVGDLGIVRTTGTDGVGSPSPVARTELSGVEAFTREASAEDRSPSQRPDREYVAPPAAPAVGQVWFGDGVPVGAARGNTSASRDWLDRDPIDGNIDVAVVCNGQLIDDEVGVYDVWSGEVSVPFDVEVHRDLSVDELRAVLSSDVELFHYVGHATPAGLECRDGRLDCRTLDGVSAQAVLLNACDSYEQGVALVENGAIGGVVTVTEVPDELASSVGLTVARMLDSGYPLRVVADVIRGHLVHGDQYVLVGEGNLQLSGRDSATAPLYEVRRVDGDLEVRMVSYFHSDVGVGAVYNHQRFDAFGHVLTGNWTEWTRVEAGDEAFLEFGEFPVLLDGELRWNTEVTPEEL